MALKPLIGQYIENAIDGPYTSMGMKVFVDSKLIVLLFDMFRMGKTVSVAT
jgi:hypothetical protein